jgi:carbonic anhydrase/acetyltransferase-like protein (isoleucine patch superfamily)
MFKLRTIVIALSKIILALVIAIQAYQQPAFASITCNPTSGNLPICPSTATADKASFLDPTSVVTNPNNITIAEKSYVAPFAKLNATSAPILIGEESNVQDQVSIQASGTGVEIGPRSILAHMATVKGAAKIGIAGSTGPFTEPVTNVQFNNDVPETFLGFNSEVDGAIIQKNSLVNFLSRVGPNVTLPSGKITVPGKNITTNQEASDGALGKVTNITQADVAFMEGVIEVNEAFSKGYTTLAQTNSSSVRGINDAPTTSFNPGGAPTLAGVITRDPNFRNRIIGNVIMQNSRAQLDQRMGSGISLRADEGQPFNVGEIFMANDVVFHALEFTNLTLGGPIGYGPRALVHGGRQVVNGVANGSQTSIGNYVGLGPNSVVFRSVIGNVSAVGSKSAVFNSTLPSYSFIGSNLIYANNGALVIPVEW